MIFSSHAKRWITGLSLLPLLIFWLGWGNPLMFALLVALACMAAMWEYFRMTLGAGTALSHMPLTVVGFIAGLAVLCTAYVNEPWLYVFILALNMMAAGFWVLLRYPSGASAVQSASFQVQGVIYIPVLLSSLIYVRSSEDGRLWIFFTLVIVFAGDIGAYYAGSYLGRHKLCPAVSPNKTVEGSAGGLLANVLAGGIMKALLLPSLPWAPCIAMFLCIGAAGQIGDLFESALKRSVQVKDSGNLLPGHGGMLDRIDALLFASPIALIFKKYILG